MTSDKYETCVKTARLPPFEYVMMPRVLVEAKKQNAKTFLFPGEPYAIKLVPSTPDWECVLSCATMRLKSVGCWIVFHFRGQLDTSSP